MKNRLTPQDPWGWYQYQFRPDAAPECGYWDGDSLGAYHGDEDGMGPLDLEKCTDFRPLVQLLPPHQDQWGLAASLAREYAEIESTEFRLKTRDQRERRREIVHQVSRYSPVMLLYFAQQVASYVPQASICGVLVVLTNRLNAYLEDCHEAG